MRMKWWAQARDIFEAALEREAGGRQEFLVEACQGDESLLREVSGLMNSLGSADGFMHVPTQDAPPPPKPAADEMEGRVIGPYKLIRRVGSGGMGSVYAAARMDRSFEKIVAIKLIKPGMDSEDVLRRFRNERQVLAALEHPNIARLLDGGSTPEGSPFLVMEYVEGMPITRYCDVSRLGVTERLRLFQGVCSAVQCAHRNLVIHRDLKPGNILVTPLGVPKLLDFGIAKLLHAGPGMEDAPFTRTSVRPMTPQYASPEQVRGDPITTVSDVYALGVLLYELLTGRLPYRLKTGSAPEIEHAIRDAEPERPSVALKRVSMLGAPTPQTLSERRAATPDKLRRQLRGDLDVILMTALRKEPQRRYSSVERLAGDIDSYLENRPVAARKDTWMYRAGKFAARNRAGAAIAVCATFALCASAAVSFYFEQEAQIGKRLTVQLSNYMLSDIDSAVQSSATEARKAAIGKVLDYVNQLSPHARNDPGMRRLLITAHLKVGDLEGNMFGPNLGDLDGARKSYQEALDLARQEVRQDREIALAEQGLGGIEQRKGDQQSALQLLRKAQDNFRKLLDATPRDPRAIKDLAGVYSKIGYEQYSTGDLPAAFESYQHFLDLATQVEALNPTREARRNVALGQERVGEILSKDGRQAEGLDYLKRSRAIYEALLKGDPSDTTLVHDIALTHVFVANALPKVRPKAAIDEYRKAVGILKTLAASDTANRQYQAELNSAVGSWVKVLLDVGDRMEARGLTAQSLAALRTQASQPGASLNDVWEYCYLLLTTPFHDLQDSPAALRYARTAVAQSGGKNPLVLDLLARAQEQNGDFAGAVATEGQAVRMLPAAKPGAQVSDNREELEGNLEKFRRELARGAGTSSRR